MIKRKGLDSKGVSPVVAEILLIAIVIVLSAVVFFMAFDFAPNGQQSITMSFTGSEMVDGELHLYMSDVSPDVQFDECSIVISSPDPSAPVYEVSLTNQQSYDVLPNETLSISIVDLGGDGRISAGDYFSLQNESGSLYQGDWGFNLIYDDTGDAIASMEVTVAQ